MPTLMVRPVAPLLLLLEEELLLPQADSTPLRPPPDADRRSGDAGDLEEPAPGHGLDAVRSFVLGRVRRPVVL